MLINSYRFGSVTPVDGERQMSSYGVLNVRNTLVGVRTPNGPWTSAGTASSASAGFDSDLDIYPIVAFDTTPGTNGDLIEVDITGTYNGSPQTDTITVTLPARYEIGSVPFHTITAVEVVTSTQAADGFFSVGGMIRISSGNTGYDQVTWAGAIDADVQLTVSATPRTMNGALADASQSQGTPIDFAAMGLSGTTIFVKKTANTAARDINIQGTPNDETVSLTAGSGTSVSGTEELDSLDDIVVTAGTSSAPFAAIGIVTRVLTTWPS